MRGGTGGQTNTVVWAGECGYERGGGRTNEHRWEGGRTDKQTNTVFLGRNRGIALVLTELVYVCHIYKPFEYVYTCSAK